MSDRTRTWIRQLHAADVLGRVIPVLREAGVDALPVKGVVTGTMLYADPGERPLEDVDLRVVAEDLPRVVAAGKRAGWQLVAEERVYRSALFDVLGMPVDVETSVGPPGMCALTVADMIAHAARDVTTLGFPHLRPELHEHAVLLCVNVFKDKLAFSPAHAFTDLARIVVVPGFDADTFVATCRRARVVCLAWIVADYLARTEQSTAWAEIRTRLAPRAPRPGYVRLFRALLSVARNGAVPQAALVLAARAGSDDPTRRAYAYAKLAQRALGRFIA